ncbi:MAG: PAS domain-containing protein, partial [Opitutaceae bacterium]|nr:PAS domain-containing protein [Opitutaceae bacterium]
MIPAAPVTPTDSMVAPWELSIELVLVRGPDGRVVAVNQAFARKFGVPLRNWAGSDPSVLIHSDDLKGWRQATGRLSHAPFRCSHEHRWLTAQGWRWIAWEESAVRDEEGLIIAFRAIGRDVTKRRLSEEH